MTRRLTVLLASALLATALVPAALAARTSSPAPAPVQALDAAAGDPGLDHGIELVHAATDVQLERAGLDTVDAAEPATPSLETAIEERFAQEATTLTPAVQDELARLEEAPEPVREALADLIASFNHLHATSASSFAAVDTVDTLQAHSPAGVWQANDVDPAPALAARGSVLDAIGDLAVALDAAEATPDVQFTEAPALAIDLAGEDTVYDQDIALVVDAAGDDTYLNNAGGTGVEDLDGADGFAAAALVDLGGADEHGQPELQPRDRRSGANGGGLEGVGMLVDDGASDDTYAAYADGVNGGAFLGAGLLLDAGGDDTYSAEGWGANGGGYPGGLAQLVDLGGDDAYTGTYEAVNGGAMMGTGVLYDAGGQDLYRAERSGTNGGGWAGHGLLVDRGSGDDTYQATAGGVNGGAGIAGLGLLYDEAGTDVYEDEEGGTGQDRTVMPKGVAGAQIDG